jgi:hypothetical protein
MTFDSQHAFKIWDKLYTVRVPDQLTLDPSYIERFGVPVANDPNVDKMMSTNFTTVMIPIIKIMEYFLNGVEVQIPSREDMIQIHKDIEDYLGEWEYYVKHTMHGKTDLEQHKTLISSLEKLSKHIYNRAGPKEVIENLFVETKLGFMSPLEESMVKEKEPDKPDYTSIMRLIKNKGGSRF